MFNKYLFDFPKPVEVIKQLVSQVSNTDDIILDFFSGSATTAHAVMQLNAEDGGHRKFIMVQLPEPCDEASEAYKAGFYGTDEAGLVERFAAPVRMVRGEEANKKITTREDLPAVQKDVRIGHGYDVHRLTEERALILCGESIPHERGLLGHSDADVALHALMDAMLGAAALGDIGRIFPDSDDRYKGISSMKLLEKVCRLIDEKGFAVGNADITVIAQQPKLAPYIPRMRAHVARALGVEEDCVNVKATTTERLGFAGREEGIAAEAVCLLRQK